MAHEKRSIIWLFVAALVGVAHGCNGGGWSESGIEESKGRGNDIVAALAAYKAEKGRFPPQLSELVSKYIKSIDPPCAGEGKWIYKVTPEGDFYHISFRDSGSRPKLYERTSIDSHWGYDSGG